MNNVFLWLLNSSLSAVWVVLAVLLVRLLLKKAPKWIACVLWGLVALRLLCPFSIESVFSLVPEAQPIAIEREEQPDTPVQTPSVTPPVTNTVVTPPTATDVPVTPVPEPQAPVTSVPTTPPAVGAQTTPKETGFSPEQLLPVATGLWLAGLLAMGVYAAVSTWRVYRQVRESAPLRDNIRQCDHLGSPFILGVFRPRIYLPSYLTEEQMAYVIAHEQAHLRRRDHWWKPLGFLLLAVHWFNPLLWVAYVLLCRDIELACDERVIKDMEKEERLAYSETLLACSMPRRLLAACPLAFGENGVKQRIRSVLHYKKPAFWVLVVAVIACVAVAVCFLTNPPTDKAATEPTTQQKDNTPLPETRFVTYVCNTNGTLFQLDLVKSNDCRFGTHMASSYRAEGTYTQTATHLTLQFADFKLVFVRQGETYVFDGNASDPIPETMGFGKDYTLPHGTVFFQDVNREIAQRLTLSRMSWVSDELERQLYAAVPQDGGEEYLPAFCLYSRAEWDSFLRTYWGDALSADTAWAEEIQKKIAVYDEAFFEEYTLLVAYYHHGSYSVTPYFVGIDTADGVLTLLVDVYEPESQDTAVGEWFLTLGIPKDTTNVGKEVQAKVRQHIAEGVANPQSIPQAEITQTPLLGRDERLFRDESLTYRPETDDEQAPTFRFTTREELDAFIAKYRDSLGLNMRQPYAPANFIETVAKYDENFFANNSLLVTYVMAESGTTYHQVSAVTYYPTDSVLAVQIDRYDQPPINGEPTAYLFTVTVGKVYDGLAKTCLAQLTPLQEVDWSDSSTTPTVNENFPTHTTQVKAEHSLIGRVVEVSKEGKYLVLESTGAAPFKTYNGQVKVRLEQYAGHLPTVGDVLKVLYNERVAVTNAPPEVYALAIDLDVENLTTQSGTQTTVSTTTPTIKKPSLISTTTTTTTTRGTVRPTQPPRSPNAAGVVNIVNWTQIWGYGVPGILPPPFYVDKDYTYGFGSPYTVKVHYADGSTRSVGEAMERGDITAEDLDSFGIHYFKNAWEPAFYVRAEANKAFGEPELFYSDETYDYYFTRPISKYVYLQLPYRNGVLLTEALQKELITIEEFINGEFKESSAKAEYYRVEKVENSTTPSAE